MNGLIQNIKIVHNVMDTQYIVQVAFDDRTGKCQIDWCFCREKAI